VIKCPNCGVENEPGSRFCAECGTDLRSISPSQPSQPGSPFAPPSPPTPPISLPEPPAPPAAQPPTQPTWSYSPPPSGEPGQPIPTPPWAAPAPTPPPGREGRPKWLIAVLGVLVAFLLCCCVVAVYGSTSSGQDRFEDWGTRVSEWSTKQADK
jgi:hypothetical protein